MKQWKMKITKLRKFGIEDPILQLFVSKYENIIDWKHIRNQEDLSYHITESMLPKLLNKTEFGGKKTYF